MFWFFALVGVAGLSGRARDAATLESAVPSPLTKAMSSLYRADGHFQFRISALSKPSV